MSPRGVAQGAAILDGRALARDMLDETASVLEGLRVSGGTLPGLRIVMVGSDPASAVYARRILFTADRVGIPGEVVEVVPEAGAIRLVLRALSEDTAVGGVILQLPLPVGLRVRDVIDELDPAKDLDGIHYVNAGLVARGEGGFAPSCAEAALQILRRSGIPRAGRPAVVIGRSNVVGKPAQSLLMQEHATVTVCHRQTRDLAGQLRGAEIVVAAAGYPGLVTGDDIQPGAVVVDCGINVLPDGRIAGDVDLDSVMPIASAVTPVPGGVGPVTNAVLMEHFARAVTTPQASGVRGTSGAHA